MVSLEVEARVGSSMRSVFFCISWIGKFSVAHRAPKKSQTPPSFLDVLVNFIFFIPKFSKYKKYAIFFKKSENQTKILLDPNPGSENSRPRTETHCVRTMKKMHFSKRIMWIFFFFVLNILDLQTIEAIGELLFFLQR